MTEPVDEMVVRLALIRACSDVGSQKRFAHNHGISEGHVSAVAIGVRSPGSKLLAVLGFEKVVRYIRKPTLTSGESPHKQAELVP